MRHTGTKSTSKEQQAAHLKTRVSAPPRLNVALSVVDTLRVLPAFFGEAIGAFHLSLSTARAERHRDDRQNGSRKAAGVRKENAPVLRAARFSHE